MIEEIQAAQETEENGESTAALPAAGAKAATAESDKYSARE